MSTDQHTLPDGRLVTIDGEPAPAGAVTEPPPRHVQLAWGLKAKTGHGWVREIYKGRAIVTSLVAEAEQYPSLHIALDLAARLDHPDHVPFVPGLIEIDVPGPT